MARKRKSYSGWNLKSYNEGFQHQGKTWRVVHKTTDTIYAVELSSKGLAQGAVERFPV